MLFTVIAITLCSHSLAAGKTCEELKADLSAKIEAKGVKKFSLDIVESAQVGDKKVVGSCAGGKNKLVYVRG